MYPRAARLLLTTVFGSALLVNAGPAAKAENPWVEQARNRELLRQAPQQPAYPPASNQQNQAPIFQPSSFQQPTSPPQTTDSYVSASRDNPHNFRNPDMQRAGSIQPGYSSQQQTQQGFFPKMADSNSWQAQQARNRERQAQAMQQQAQQGYAPQVAQGQRWENEWRQQHPGEPMPNFGQLEKMHRGEIQANINSGFNQMRQKRQAELQRNRSWARENQMHQNAAQHITWSAAQWRQWDQRYDNEQKQNAQDYLKNIAREGERMDEEWRRTGINPYTH